MRAWLQFNSLTHRLTLYYAAAFSVFLGVSFLVLYWSIGAVLDNRMDEDLEEDIEEFSQLLVQSGRDGVIEEMEKEVTAGEHETVFLYLFRSNGVLEHATDLQYWPEFKPDRHIVHQQFQGPGDETLQALEFANRDSATHIIYAALSPDYMMIIGESNEERDDIMELLAIAFTLVFMFTVPLASLLVWLLTQRSIAGITAVSDAALDIEAGDLDRRVNVSNQVMEVQTLADTFDAMAERIQKLIRNMHEMTDNIAHDLRSPISRLRLLSDSVLQSPASESQYRQAAEDSIAECDRLIRMINTSLDVAETEAGVINRAHTQFDMSALVGDACELFETVSEEQGITLTAQLDTPCLITGDITSVQRMVANLLDNAVKHTPTGGKINVASHVTGDTIEIDITDSGIGIDPADYDNIFNRFYRIEPSRSSGGCGLGLSYSRAVARAHGGDIHVVSKKGHYSKFTITLPCRPTVKSLATAPMAPA